MLKLGFKFPIIAVIAGLFSLTACAVLLPPSPETPRAKTSERAPDTRQTPNSLAAPDTPEAPDTPGTLDTRRTRDTIQTIEMGRNWSQEVAPNSSQAYLPPAQLPTIQPGIDTGINGVTATEPAPAPALSQSLTASPAGDSTPGAIDNYFVSGFACTGSMRPALDCGDEAVFLNPPFPQPLAVGDVVSFSVDIACRYYKSQDISKAHRIIDIRYEGTAPFYTTQGDASSDPDPCEITLGQVDGVMVEVRKGARPQDIIDVSEYDRAKLAVTEAKAEYALLLELYDLEKVAYEALLDEYDSLVEHYRRGDLSYQVVSEFYEGPEKRRASLNRLRQDLNDLSDRANLAIDEVDRLYRQLFVR